MNETAAVTHWGPGILVLALFAVAGFVFVLIVLRRSSPAPAKLSEDAIADLERRAQLLMDQLRELSADRHQLGDERFAAEKARLEQAAAEALRARDQRGTAPASSAAPNKPSASSAPKGFFQRNPQLAGAFWGGGVVLFFVVLGLVLSREQSPQAAGEKPGMSSRPPMQQQTPPPAAADDDRELQEALSRLSEHPDDVDFAARLAHELIRRQRFEEAERITEQSLGFDPFHVESRIHRAILRTTHGATQQAIEELQHLAITYPHSDEARLFVGGLKMDLGDRRGALESFERYLAEAPPDEVPPQLTQMVMQLRGELSSAPR